MIRTEISGSFEMKISSQADYEAFVEVINASKDENGEILMEVYVNNTNKVKYGRFFVAYSVRLDKDLSTGKRFRKFTVTIEEA